ncbi:MAG: ATP-binding protein, partial [Byssovorax sp.]
MVKLSNYTVGERIYEGTETLLYRGSRDEDRRPVIIKLPRSEQPTPRELARLRNEFAMLQFVDVPRVVRAYALEKHEHGVALVLESIDGQTLGELLDTERLGLKSALQIAAAIAEILEGVHRLGIIHRDIKPHNILVRDATGEVHLIDFGMATRMEQDTCPASGPRTLEGTLAYLSPEQTGYMNRPLDHRADLYSLGVTLFQMLTGSLPFTAEDPRELVHSHVARTPRSPRDLDAAIPEAVSDLVMKLLAKAPEERYQAALGLGADLAECLRQIEATGTVGVLELGRRDAAAVLRLPQKLYGRADEEAALLAAFERTESGGAELLLVAGSSGIGKSALVHETRKAIERRGGHFISGKFDQLSRNVPYAPVARAFRDLLGRLLGESAERLSIWRERLARALGANGQVLVDLIPELALLLGPQPAVPALGPTESQNRFNRAVSSFVDVFTTAPHPLVLVLDDLQWADAGSLKLLQVLLADPGRRHLLILGAYRESEASAAHPISLTLIGLRGAGVAVSEIRLGPLGAPEIAELLAHALSEGAARVAELSRVILEKTGGNPFFVGQFLRSLHAERLIRFDEGAGAWAWDVGEIEAREVTSNVVEFMAGKLLLLAPAAQRALTLAACIGHEFDLRTLVTLHQQPPAAVAAALGEALREGLVLPVHAAHRFLHGALDDDGAAERAAGVEVRYRFLHDRVQQAAYSLIADADRAATHLFIGRLMLAGRTPEAHDEALFELMGHLNIGAPLVTDALERARFAELDLAAGRRAKASNAYETAAECLRAGAAFLPESAWSTRHDLCFALHLEQAECKYLAGRFERAEDLFQLLLDRARSNVEKASVFTLQVKLYQVAGRYDDGVTLALRELGLFDLHFPSTDEALQEAMAEASTEIFELLGGRQIPELIDHPLMTDPEHRAVLQMLNILLPCAYIGRPRLFPLSAMKAVAFSLRHGNAPESCFAY